MSAKKSTRKAAKKPAKKAVAKKAAKKAAPAKKAAAKAAVKVAPTVFAAELPDKVIRTLAEASKARTVVYCHGIGNKPLEKKLRSDWDRALFGSDQGERTRMAYWVDRTRYPKPEGAETKALSIESELGSRPADKILQDSLAGSDRPQQSKAFVADLARTLKAAESDAEAEAVVKGAPRVKSVEAKGIFSPVNDFLTKIFLADVNDFLFNQGKRQRMVETVKARLATGGGPFVVIGHSQGSMVVYQALMELGNTVDVSLFVTLGSPLGLPQVTDELKKWHGKKLPIPPCVKQWVNIARDGDVVCADQTLGDEYKSAGKAVIDLEIDDFDWMPGAHSVAYYLSYSETRKAVFGVVDKARFQPVSAVTISKDLSGQLDDDAAARVPVLIELVDRGPGRDGAPDAGLLENARTAVVQWLEHNVAADDAAKEAIQLEELSRYVSANLTRSEVERMASELSRFLGENQLPSVYRMFKNSRKKALMMNSVGTIQVRTAHLGYNACGKGITWGVLDTGVDAAHPHFNHPQLGGEFQNGCTIVENWDCTKRGKVIPNATGDLHGHGTHVAGIIAGGMQGFAGDPDCNMFATAPKAAIVSYKVLGDDGYGSDAWIIKAIDDIAERNEAARNLVIHGVNLSLGSSFDPESFGCGDSPLCSSLMRLIRQGVVVVLAAGNEGSGEVVVDGNATRLSLGLSIGDPANLEEAIAVGSVHPTLPHRYGTSYFSSRGPTADGRMKPDLVAPGERIWSCRSGGRSSARNPKLSDLYVDLSGTSMAAPHVSGMLAAFLSVRREFIGYPEMVKKVLLAHCTDLSRDRYHQGAGLPNLAKMLLHT